MDGNKLTSLLITQGKIYAYISTGLNEKGNQRTIIIDNVNYNVNQKIYCSFKMLNNNKIKKILFVCHGNICRSPMAEFVMKDLVSKAGLDNQFYIESAATSTEEIGNEVYPPAKRKLAEHGISCMGKTARQMTHNDYQRFDLLIGMDTWNLRNMNRICGGDPEGKIRLLLDYTNRPGDVADPWYTGNFEATWRDVFEGCTLLLKDLTDRQ